MMGNLKGKVAMVTGASKGIGAAIAKHLAGDGASVVVNYASGKSAAESVVAEILQSGGFAIAVQCDVSKAADIDRLFREAKASFGALDILVNNAGVYQFGPLEAVTEAEYRRQFDTNVLGLLLATQEALNHFPEHGGSVVNVGSAASETTPSMSAIYSATKASVTAITRVLAKELAPKKIRVNQVSPGGVETEGAHALGIMGSDFQKHIVAMTPLGRMGQPSDIAPVVSFLASDEAAWLTGEVILASGGMR
jgi:3-oxoacyl-[acyl-carrier protein] reductase